MLWIGSFQGVAALKLTFEDLVILPAPPLLPSGALVPFSSEGFPFKENTNQQKNMPIPFSHGNPLGIPASPKGQFGGWSFLLPVPSALPFARGSMASHKDLKGPALG